ncbi:endonuclease V [Nocardia sp. NPDC057227]|uniref:endonuclease V n=1 Tax=Nocardia sp. NPDC057227 TaxID=3346056 RepID=UPI00363E0DED
MRLPAPELPADADAAVALQERLRHRVAITPLPARIRTVAGLDSAYTESGAVAAAVVVLDAATLLPVATAVAHGHTDFPYLPGLLAFRELPTALRAIEQLATPPDVLICDAHGLAHPRRFGLACHLGVLTGLPTVGVAKNAWGEHAEPGRERGASADVTVDGDVVGRALRTQDGVKPVFVSVGHRADPDSACALVLALTPRFRLPETTRAADRLCRDALRDGP